MDTLTNGEALYFTWKRGAEIALSTQQAVVTGVENIPLMGNGVVAANHLNWKDIFFLGAVVPRQMFYVATNELFSHQLCEAMILEHATKVMGTWLKKPMAWISKKLAQIIVPRVIKIGTIPIKRNNHDRLFFEEAKEALRKGRLICIFPEGGTGVRGRLRKFKKGIAKMVYDLFKEGVRRIPVLPVGIKETDKFYLPGRRVYFHVGKPLYIEDHIMDTEKETLQHFSEVLRNQVNELIK